MEREASEMAVSPLVNRPKPPPVPEIPTGTFTFGHFFRNASAAAIEIGATVLDPSILTSPSSSASELSTSAAEDPEPVPETSVPELLQPSKVKLPHNTITPKNPNLLLINLYPL